jgi:uncharacterized protein
MHDELSIQINGENLMLLGDGGLIIPSTQSLLVADVHIGKAAHFRKAGIPIPASSARADLQRLRNMLRYPDIKECVFLGDLGHSAYNKEWIDFQTLRNDFPEVSFVLIKGNHDAAPDAFYLEQGLDAVCLELQRSNFFLTHEPCEKEGMYNLAGHLHPAISLKGNAKQKLTLACFVFQKHAAILPAFTQFSGKYLLDIQPSDEVFVVSQGKVGKVQV